MTVPPTPDAQSGSNAKQLSPRSAIAVGILFMFCGAIPVLAGLGLVRAHSAPGVQPWVVIAAGSVFILAGLAVINGYAVAGGSQADGSLPADAPFIARLIQYVLGLAIVGLLFAVFAWVSFGPGERQLLIIDLHSRLVDVGSELPNVQDASRLDSAMGCSDSFSSCSR